MNKSTLAKLKIAGIKAGLTVGLLAVLTAGLLASCASTAPGAGPESAAPVENKGAPRIAVILPVAEHPEDPMASDVMIGINRLAQEFNGTIYGREGTIEFGHEAEFTILVTEGLDGTHSNIDAVTEKIRGFDPGRYDMVFGAGYHYREPLRIIAEEVPGTVFVAVDNYGESDAYDNYLILQYTTAQAAFLAGAVAAERFPGERIGFIGGMDIPFINEEFRDGFLAGVEYMDARSGSRTEVLVDYVGNFGDYDTGYGMAAGMFDQGVRCIYQAAGYSGIGVLDAARDRGLWAIGVDTDQGLERALDQDHYRHILTSTVKKWGNGVYLVGREYLTEGSLPRGTQIVGLAEDCTDLAVNPYNAPILGDQLDTIEELKSMFAAGREPYAASSAPREQNVWKSLGEKQPAVEILTVTVNDPILSPEIPAHYGSILRDAMSTEFHKVGLYRVIDSEQVDRLLAEINFSLDGVSEENTRLEVGRLVAAQAIVFVNLGGIGESVNIDCKLVDVETGLLIAASRETYPDFEILLDNLYPLIRQLK
ncbi:MAG: BMP family ABC transporter substrate-binding protein [Sediminispirochaetaceae bacterium]